MEVYIDDETKLTLHGLRQHYCKLRDNEKNRKLFDLLDALEFNQVCSCHNLDLLRGLKYFHILQSKATEWSELGFSGCKPAQVYKLFNYNFSILGITKNIVASCFHEKLISKCEL